MNLSDKNNMSSKMEQVPVTYDTYGRMKFHSDYHGRQKTPRTTSDEKFLIENYAKIGPEQVSFALERTIHTIMTRAYELRKSGRMDKPIKARFGAEADGADYRSEALPVACSPDP